MSIENGKQKKTLVIDPGRDLLEFVRETLPGLKVFHACSSSGVQDCDISAADVVILSLSPEDLKKVSGLKNALDCAGLQIECDCRPDRKAPADPLMKTVHLLAGAERELSFDQSLACILERLRLELDLERLILTQVNGECRREEVKLGLGFEAGEAEAVSWPLREPEREMEAPGATRCAEILDGSRSPFPGVLRDLMPGVLFKAPVLLHSRWLGSLIGSRPRSFSDRELEAGQVYAALTALVLHRGRLRYQCMKAEQALEESQSRALQWEEQANQAGEADRFIQEMRTTLKKLGPVSRRLLAELKDREPVLARLLESITPEEGCPGKEWRRSAEPGWATP